MAKRGQKSYKESEKRREKLYKAYLKQYNAASAKYAGNLSMILTRNQFDAMYQNYRDAGVNQNVIRTMVKDQQNITSEQAHALLKLAKRKKIKVKLIDFFQSNKSAAVFWNYVYQHGGFHQALYVDDDPQEIL